MPVMTVRERHKHKRRQRAMAGTTPANIGGDYVHDAGWEWRYERVQHVGWSEERLCRINAWTGERRV